MNELLARTQIGRPTKVTILTEHLKHNVRVVQSIAPGTEVLAMVKANAYGHGIVGIAKALEEIDVSALGVASIQEALQLRHAGVFSEIVLMEGCFSAEELEYVAQFSFTLIVHQIEQLLFLERYQGTQKIPVWLKVNIGMNRLGVLPDAVVLYYQRLSALSCVAWQGLVGHFSDTDRVEDLRTVEQMDLFMQATYALPGKKSVANSGGILAWPRTHLDRVRPGIMLYGVSPFYGACGADHQLKPVMQFASRIIAVQEVPGGGTVGYGSTWQVPPGKSARIGIVAAGYGDGYPKGAPLGTPVWVSGKQVPLVGRVSMDMLTVDLSEHETAGVGSSVVLWGSELPVESVASHTGRTPYELLCGLAPRVPVCFA